MTNRTLQQRFSGIQTADGEGVKLTRIIGSHQLDRFDPFLLLDCFESDDADDYIGGFPTHPHRGFETVTYLLNGRMRHKDNAGHEGVIEPGGVQWMTAGKGILHSEMPEQDEGLLKGFQLWVNLPAADKMTAPAYQEYTPEVTPLESRDDGTQIRVIAGVNNHGTKGPVNNSYTQPTYMDITLAGNKTFEQSLPSQHNAFIYIVEGELTLQDGEQPLVEKRLGLLSHGETLTVNSGASGARFLLIAGKPLNEPVARSGPFVMNTQAELIQAFNDYRRGGF